MSELKVDKVSPRTGTYVSLNTVGSKNIIINGDMSIAQRSTAVTGKTADGYYTTDRWNHSINLGTWSIDQSTDVPSGEGFAKSHKMTCTTGASTSAGTQTYLHTRLEGQNLQYLKKGTANAESLTLSFWGKSATTTGTMTVELFDTDNSRQISKQISLTTSWTKYTITYDGDTTGTFNNDNGASLYLIFWISAGSNFNSGTLNTSWNSNTNANRAVGQTNFAVTNTELYITGVQLEAGTTASDFEFLPYDVNLRRCLRYCWKHGGEITNQYLHGQGGYNDANYLAFGLVSPPVPMRVAPSVTENGSVIVHRLNTDYTGWNWGFITGVQSQSWFVSANKSSHGVTAQHSVVKCSTTSDFFIYSSEL